MLSYVLITPTNNSTRRFNIWIGRFRLYTCLVKANTKLDQFLTYWLGTPEW